MTLHYYFQSYTKPSSITNNRSSGFVCTHSAKILGLIISDEMSVEQQVINICWSWNVVIRKISAITKYTINTTIIKIYIIYTFVLSHLDIEMLYKLDHLSFLYY